MGRSQRERLDAENAEEREVRQQHEREPQEATRGGLKASCALYCQMM